MYIKPVNMSSKSHVAKLDYKSHTEPRCGKISLLNLWIFGGIFTLRGEQPCLILAHL